MDFHYISVILFVQISYNCGKRGIFMYKDYLNSDIKPDEIYAPPRTIQKGETPFREEYESYLQEYPGRGTLKVQISVARGAFPLKNVLVDVSQIYNGIRYSLYNDVTDISGIVDNMVLPARSTESTLNHESAQLPEAEYLVTIFHPDFQEMSDCAVVIHDKTETILPISLVPLTGERKNG